MAKREKDNCPECGTHIPMCTCGVWDCGFYTHLHDECKSEAGDAYRQQIAESIKRRDSARL